MTVLVEKSAVTLEDGIKTLIESAITDYKISRSRCKITTKKQCYF